tara:strand:- start:290 stop:796 length:507 start_codon:yes stop_codon:yes gene_type:complete
VATVVAKLFNIVHPDRAYFGQKDAAQTILISRMTADLNFDVEIVISPTVREPSGLAMSSRNEYLSLEDRQTAALIYEALSFGRDYCRKKLDVDVVLQSCDIIGAVEKVLSTNRLLEVKYISVDSGATMKSVDSVTADSKFVISAAVIFAGVRLIDNVVCDFSVASKSQ